VQRALRDVDSIDAAFFPALLDCILLIALDPSFGFRTEVANGFVLCAYRHNECARANKEEGFFHCSRYFGNQSFVYQPNTHANMSGATMVASLSIIYFGVLMSSFPQVIFSLGTAPE